MPVKQVALVRDGAALAEHGAPQPEALAWSLNEWDSYALETALTLLETGGDGAEESELLVAAVGPEQAEEGLRACIARGAGRAVRVWHESLAQADALVIARVLAALAVREGAEVILCGAQSADEGGGGTPAALAGLLDLPRALGVSDVQRDGAQLIVQRELEGGAVERLRLRPPAVLAVQSSASPRHANLRAIRAAREAPLLTLTPGELGIGEAELEANAGARVRALRKPEHRGAARMLEGSAAQIAARISEILAAERAA